MTSCVNLSDSSVRSISSPAGIRRVEKPRLPPTSITSTHVQIWSGGPNLHSASYTGNGTYCASLTCAAIGETEVTAFVDGTRVHDSEILECTPPVCSQIDRITLSGSSHSFRAIQAGGTRLPSSIVFDATFSNQGQVCVPVGQVANDCNLVNKVCWRKISDGHYKWDSAGPTLLGNSVAFNPPQQSGYTGRADAFVRFKGVTSNRWVMCAPANCPGLGWVEAEYNPNDANICKCPPPSP